MTFFTAVMLCGVAALCVKAHAQETALAFPGAYGFGKYASGGRGGSVYIVTNLKDDGPGSFRDAVEKTGPRTILFAVSGNIALQSSLIIDHGDVTIAGQSAPGDGICFQYYPVTINSNNVIVRFLRFRLGDTARIEGDALGGGNCENVIIDHCSISWATDECASFYNNKKFTMQWCIISESLNKSVHSKGAHGYGGIWGGVGASFHRNLLAHHTSRLPRFSGSSTTPNSPDELVDFRNNVIYNWSDNSTYGGELGRYNVVNNYYKPGPATTAKANWMVNPSSPFGKFFIEGNIYEGEKVTSADNWRGGVKAAFLDSVRVLTPFAAEFVPSKNATEAFQSVLENAGASLKRDIVDKRIVREVASGTASFGKDRKGIIDSQEDVNGWPSLEPLPPEQDTDRDGMPDKWETKYNLDVNNPSDGNTRLLDDHYTNLEFFLNELVRNTFR
jgi:hypothetical protein